jgi:hypothetical protein
MYLLKALNTHAWYLVVVDNLQMKLFSCMEVDNLKDVNYPLMSIVQVLVWHIMQSHIIVMQGFTSLTLVFG